MIVGFDHDDPSILEEQYEFLQAAQIPIVLVNALEAVPRTPLYNRLKAEGRLLTGHAEADDTTRYKSGVGMTNFRPRLMTGEALKSGTGTALPKAVLAQGVHGQATGGQPVPFQERDLPPRAAGQLPRRVRAVDQLLLGKGRPGRQFFWGCLWKALGRAPRVVGEIAHLPGDVRPLRGGPPAGVSWDPLGNRRGRAGA